MALTLGQKAQRALVFLLGIAQPRVASKLVPFGFDQEALDEGWRRLRAISGERLDTTPAPTDPRDIQRLDEWENLWFPIVSAVLVSRFPALHAWLFRNLSQQSGINVVISVGTLSDRLDLLSAPDHTVPDEVRVDASAALEILGKRGFSEAVRKEAKDLLTSIGRIGELPEPSPEEEAARLAKVEADLWAWYLEWSTIAQKAVKNRRNLRSLGYGTSRKKASNTSESIDEVVAELESGIEPEEVVEDVSDLGSDLLTEGGDDSDAPASRVG